MKMKKIPRTLRIAFVFGSGLCLAAGHMSGTILMFDDFAGTTLDAAKWTAGGWPNNNVEVNDGLFLTTAGASWDQSVRSVDQFNFHAAPLQYVVEIGSHPNPADTDNWGSGSFQQFRLEMLVGPATGFGGIVDNTDPQTHGFGFGIRWRTNDRLDLHSFAGSALGIPTTDLTAMPSSIIVDLDATDYTITLVGATFAGGAASLSGEHGIAALDSYHFMTMVAGRGTSTTKTSEISSVTIIPEPSTYAAVLGLLAFGVMLWRRRRV